MNMDLLGLERKVHFSEDARSVIQMIDNIVGSDPETGMSFTEAVMQSHEDVLLQNILQIDINTRAEDGFVLACIHEYVATVEVITPETQDQLPDRTLYVLSHLEFDALQSARGKNGQTIELDIGPDDDMAR